MFVLSILMELRLESVVRGRLKDKAIVPSKTPPVKILIASKQNKCRKETNILNKLYFTSGCMFIFALLVVFKLSKIQFVQGEAYRSLAEKRSIKMLSYLPIGNVYSVDGSLLATSVPKYDIRIDLVTSSERTFQSNIQAL